MKKISSVHLFVAGFNHSELYRIHKSGAHFSLQILDTHYTDIIGNRFGANLIGLYIQSSFQLFFKGNLTFQVCQKQCDQIGRFLKDLEKKFASKNSHKNQLLFGYFEKILQCKNCCGCNYLGNFWKPLDNFFMPHWSKVTIL